MTHLLKKHWPSLLFFFALIALVQTIGNFITMPNIQPWYNSLNHPFWRPPNWVFGPVWTILYFMLAYVGWRLWISFDGSVGQKLKQPVIRFYFIQLILNFIWSPLFFGMHMTGLALIDLVLIIVFTVFTMTEAKKVDRTITWLLVPYLLWLLFASSLNSAIVYLN